MHNPIINIWPVHFIALEISLSYSSIGDDTCCFLFELVSVWSSPVGTMPELKFDAGVPGSIPGHYKKK
jgi:hypothetical protein